MSTAKQKKYAIVDLETTGGMARRDRITEVGIVVYDGQQIVDSFSSLVNPGRSIPREITRITGITDEMVADAPMFYEIAKQVVELTADAVFVAHNVRFDYSFLRNEFASLGYTFTRRQLCTVRLSRRVFPGLKSYSLGNLIKHFDIEVSARHRALDDAMATTELLGRILQQDYAEGSVRQMVNQGIQESKLPQGITIDFLHSLPEDPGVYYFYNSYDKVVYVGKSKNIKKRVMQHFSQSTAKATKMAQMVRSITYELTGSELVALLLESHEIKALQPEINKASRSRSYPYCIHHYTDELGYIHFDILKNNKKNTSKSNVLSLHTSRSSAKGHLSNLCAELELCDRLVHLDDHEGPCFKYKVQKCLGACILQESVQDYNERAMIGIDIMNKIFADDFILTTHGRSLDERAVVLVEEGHYRGYGYIDTEGLRYGIEEIKEAIKYVPINPEANAIVRGYMSKHKDFKIIKI